MRFSRRKEVQAPRRRLRVDPEPERLDNKFSYRSRRSEAVLNTGRQLQRDLTPRVKHGVNFWLQRFGLFILLVVLIVSIFNALTLSATPKVLPLNGSQSTFLRDLSEYQAAGHDFLAASFWNRNKITVDTQKISAQLLERFPELQSASVTVPLVAHRPIIYVQPAKPVVIVTARNGAFVVGNTGKALLRGNDTAALQKYQLPVITDQSGLKLKVDQQALSVKNVDFIQTVISQLAAKQFVISGMTLPANSNELDVQIKDQPYIVKFNLQSDKPRQEAGTFLSTIDYLKKQNTAPSKYVDVRVDGRAYYQ
jgi:hypothetical protein